uniref:Uncharacterized protein n=1 Tax=Scophthalmus maximus TaxID=52904 RepID=A0A8D3B536_SCOMX
MTHQEKLRFFRTVDKGCCGQKHSNWSYTSNFKRAKGKVKKQNWVNISKVYTRNLLVPKSETETRTIQASARVKLQSKEDKRMGAIMFYFLFLNFGGQRLFFTSSCKTFCHCCLCFFNSVRLCCLFFFYCRCEYL